MATEVQAKVALATKIAKPISIGCRMCLCLFITIVGLVFFYLVMVGLSTIATGITLEKMEPHGWPRSASRHTAAASALAFALFQLSSPSSLWSLFSAVMAACAQFCHFVIISSDLGVYADEEIAQRVFRTDPVHPLFRLLPLYTAHVVGTIAFVSYLVLTTERCFGPAMGLRRPALPIVCVAASSWITAVFALWFFDHLLYAVQIQRPLKDIMYPISFLLPLLYGQYVVIQRRCATATPEPASTGASEDKKTN